MNKQTKQLKCNKLFDDYIELMSHDNYECMKFASEKNSKLNKYNTCIDTNIKKHQKKYLEYKKCVQKSKIYNLPVYYGNY